MILECKSESAANFSSRSQQVRIVTEGWFGEAGYCISCISDKLVTTKANTIAHDFICPLCRQSYELKSSSTIEKRRIVDGAYQTMIHKIRSGEAPSLILLQYSRGELLGTPWSIKRVVAVHPALLTDSVIEARRPLSMSARRAGWQGCNLRLDRIPPDGRIEIVSGGRVIDRNLVRLRFAAAQRLATVGLGVRGWTALVLGIVRDLNQRTFRLGEVYARKRKLEEAFPENRNIEAKIRQQLQILRDLGYIEFMSRGEYRILEIVET